MHAYDELKANLRRDWATQLATITSANRDFASRLKAESLAFELDTEDDSLTVRIGARPALVYTQSLKDVSLDLDESDDRIVGVTVETFSEWVRHHDDSALKELANTLRLLGPIENSPGHRDNKVEAEIAELVPA